MVVYVYEVGGELAAEYGGTAVAGDEYVVTDHLGSTRLVVDGTGAVKGLHDYLPFGEEIYNGVGGRTVAYGGGGDLAAQKFTGKERDSETAGSAWQGLDYFGARYFNGAMARFTGADPLMASAVSAVPQSWNRFSYGLNNPLRYIDPTGELWTPSGKTDNPYMWVDTCEVEQTCYVAVAVNLNGTLRIYGSGGSSDWEDHTGIDVNTPYGAGRIVDISFIFSDPDAHITDNQRVSENYLSVDAAAALFNTGAAYHSLYPSDQDLGYNAGSMASGVGAAIHPNHSRGLFLDIAYMDSNGKRLAGDLASSAADPSRQGNITAGLISSPGSPFKGFLTLSPERFGGMAGRAKYWTGHGNHAHYQKRGY